MNLELVYLFYLSIQTWIKINNTDSVNNYIEVKHRESNGKEAVLLYLSDKVNSTIRKISTIWKNL
jgi:hypothetical protein